MGGAQAALTAVSACIASGHPDCCENSLTWSGGHWLLGLSGYSDMIFADVCPDASTLLNLPTTPPGYKDILIGDKQRRC